MLLNQSTKAIDTNQTTHLIGLWITRGGILTVGSPTSTGEAFKLLRVGTAGNVIVQNIDGNPIFFPNVQTNEYIPVEGVMVLASATVDGVVVTTTADNICWYGGM